MAKRIQDLARQIVDRYHGDASALWTQGDPDGAEVLRRLRALPGFGEQKAKIFLALWESSMGRHRMAGVPPPVITAEPALTCRSPTSSTRGRWNRFGNTRRR